LIFKAPLSHKLSSFCIDCFKLLSDPNTEQKKFNGLSLLQSKNDVRRNGFAVGFGRIQEVC